MRLSRTAAQPRAPWVVVGAAVLWNLVQLRDLTLGVAYLNDSAVHEQMVRFAATQFRSGRIPLTAWFPYLGLGSPQFLHYQSLPAMLTGLIGVAVGPNVAFRWTLYLLLSLWPVSVYLCARLFGAGRWAAAASAAMAPFLVSAVGLGYEQKAYVWTGWGVWTQLWASLALPLAWGLSWRAVREGRGFLAAIALISLTIALHFETGYLALIPLLLWPFVAGAPVAVRLRRAGVLIGGSLLTSAWVIVPLLAQRAWAATNELLRGTALTNGYGAPRVLVWLLSGQLLDYHRLPVVTVFAAVGLALACARLRTDANARALLVVLAVSLLLSFGRATFGVLVDVIPGSSDIFFRRFMMGVQLTALILAGAGLASSGSTIVRLIDGWRIRLGLMWARRVRASGWLVEAGALAAIAMLLAPAWLQLDSFDGHLRASIAAQRRSDATGGAELNRLLAAVKRDGGGRVYAGAPSNWGRRFTVGAVPAFEYLASRDIDEVGFTLRTASLMTDPEFFFDESNPGDYSLFGVHYLILPAGRPPPVPARLVLQAGAYSLWSTGNRGYVHLGRIVGQFPADRTNVGFRSVTLLRSPLPQEANFLRVAYGEHGRAMSALPPVQRDPPVGTVVSENDHLGRGEVTTVVRMRQPGVVVLSASFDPGWTVTVDGRVGAIQMVAPALVATAVPAGAHRIVFRYDGFAAYPELFALSGLTLFAVLVGGALRRRKISVRDQHR